MHTAHTQQNTSSSLQSPLWNPGRTGRKKERDKGTGTGVVGYCAARKHSLGLRVVGREKIKSDQRPAHTY